MVDNSETPLEGVQEATLEFNTERVDALHEYGPNESPEEYSIQNGDSETLIGEVDGNIYILLSTTDGTEEISASCLMSVEQARKMGDIVSQIVGELND